LNRIRRVNFAQNVRTTGSGRWPAEGAGTCGPKSGWCKVASRPTRLVGWLSLSQSRQLETIAEHYCPISGFGGFIVLK
jgi:hypothetical protein